MDLLGSCAYKVEEWHYDYVISTITQLLLFQSTSFLETARVRQRIQRAVRLRGINPYKPSVLFMGRRQTVQSQISRFVNIKNCAIDKLGPKAFHY